MPTKIPVESIGNCVKCGTYGLLGDGKCVKCWDNGYPPNNPQVQRNREIKRQHRRGMPIRQLAGIYRLRPNTIRYILWKG